MSGHLNAVKQVGFNYDDRFLVSQSEDLVINVWKTSVAYDLKKQKNKRKYTVGIVVYSPDGNSLAAGNSDNSIELWNLQNYTSIKVLEGHLKPVTCMNFSNNGKRLASGSDDLTVKVWSMENFTELSSFSGHTGTILTVKFSPNDKHIASGGKDKIIRIFNVEKEQDVKILKGHKL